MASEIGPMLQFFRKMFNTKLGVILAMAFLVLIALAFASADVTGSGNFGGVAGGDRVASVGKDRVDSSALSQAASAALEDRKAQDPKISMKSFLAAGGLTQVLDDIIDRTALREFGRRHGIVASDRLVDSEITKLAAFKGPDGKFSESAFRQALQQRGLSESLVRRDLGAGLVARQLLVPAAFGARMPLETALRYAALLGETREGAVAVIPAVSFAPKAPPAEAVLAAYYAKHSDRFIRPERRVVRYAVFGESAVKAVPPPTEAEIAARYQANKAQYAASQTRTLTQLIAPTQAAAQAIAAEVAKGTSLEKAAGEKGLATAKLDAVTRDSLAGQSSREVADAAFAAARGALAAPARSGLGWHVLRVDAIDNKPGRSLDQVRAELSAALAIEKRRAAINDLSARIEEEFDEGGNLEETARELGVQIDTTGTITADGQPYGAPPAALNPVVARILATAFAMDKEGEPQLAELDPGKLFVVFDVNRIEPSAPAPLAQIRNDVIAAWMLEQGAAGAKAAAAKVVEQVRRGTELGAAMASLGVPAPPVEQVKLNRQQLAQMQGRVPTSIALMFSMAEGTAKTLPAKNDQGWYVVSLKNIEPGRIDRNAPLVANAQRELGEAAGREYAEALRRAIRAEVGVKKNQTAIDAVRTQLGGGN